MTALLRSACGVVLLALTLLCSPWLAAQQPLPSLQSRVTDTTGSLSAEQIGDLDARLAALEQRKGSQLVVVIVASTQPEAIEEYSIRLAQAWKIGRGKVQGKKVDDGVILLVAKNDRRVRIEVGYGLEGAIPDALAKRVITEAVSPKFRQGDFYGGISGAVTDLTKLIDGEPLPEPWHDSQRQGSNPNSGQGGDDLGMFAPILFALFAGFIATKVLGRFLGSAAGGAGAGFMAMTAGLSLPIAAVVGAGGFLLLLIFAASRRGLSPIGSHTYRPGGVIFPGGFGGGGGGFGGGGGGFGGGGGGFGGGGASGDW